MLIPINSLTGVSLMAALALAARAEGAVGGRARHFTLRDREFRGFHGGRLAAGSIRGVGLGRWQHLW